MSNSKVPASSLSTPTYLSDPQIQYVAVVLEEVKRGNLLIPRFQRRFIWKPEQQLELLRSVRDGIPIGSLLVWRTSQIALKTFTRLGGQVVPGPPEPTPGATRQYLLDGHQRLSTLFGALNRPTPLTPTELQSNEEDPQEPGDYFYDLEAEDFCLNPRQRSAAHLPTNILFDSIALLRFQRDHLVGRKDSDELISRTERIANAFRNYKVPLVPLVTDNLEDATRAFQRINSSGTAMSDFHMVAALTFTDHFDFSEEMEAATATLAEVGWESLDEKYILATVRAHAGLRIVSPDADSTSKAITDNHHLLDEATANLRGAAEFLRTFCGVPSPQLLPYSYQAVVLAEAFRNASDTTLITNALARWFWQTSYLAYFLGARDNDVNDALKEIRELARSGKITFKGALSGVVEALPRRHDFRNARSKTFLLRLAALKPQPHDGTAFDATKSLGEHEARAAVQLITSGGMTAEHYSGPENRFIVEPEKVAAFRNLLLEGGDTLPQAFQASHALTEEAVLALRKKDYGRFLSLRRSQLLKLEEEFVKGLDLQYLPDMPV